MTYRDINTFESRTFTGFDVGQHMADDNAQDVIPTPVRAALTEGDDRLFAILDAGRVPFLSDRLEMADLGGRMIFRSNIVVRGIEEGTDPMAEVSPWLIEVTPDDDLIRDYFSADPNNNWQMMPRRAGILLRTSLSQDDLLRLLMRLSQLPDEAGADLFFRFHEPGMLAALCATVPTQVVAGILHNISAVIWTEDTVIDATWQAHIMRPAPDLPLGPWHSPRIDAQVRRGFADVINQRRARLILRESDIAPNDRGALVDDLTYLLGASQSSAGAMLHHLRLVAIAPPADRPYWRDMVDKGDISLAFINRKMHDYYIPTEPFAK